MLLIPDLSQQFVYNKYIKNNMKEDTFLGFSHGFNIHYNLIKVDKTKCFLVAPKAPGKSVRELF